MNNTKLIIIGAAAAIIIGLIFAFIFGRQAPEEGQLKGDILMWGVFDDSDVIQKFISQFQTAYPGVKITYQKKLIDSYEKDLVNALAAGKGPDIFYIHNTWLPKHIDKLSPIPKNYLTTSNFKDVFVDVAYDDFILENEIYALPLYADTLALFYNKDIFNTVGIANPPSTWEGLLAMVPSLTQKDESGNILRSAIAMGTAKNINRPTDILSLLMLQSGTKIFDKETQRTGFAQKFSKGGATFPSGEQALEFYTNFANPKKSVYTWNNQLPYSIDAFSESKVAMMLNYSYQIANLRLKSPHLRFDVSLMPQPRGAQQTVNFANYWGMAVSKTSKSSDLAWIFSYYMTDKAQAEEYLNLTLKPTARRDLVDVQRQASKEMGIFAQQSLSAYSWSQPDNVVVEKIFEDMIESAVSGLPIQKALETAADKIDLMVK